MEVAPTRIRVRATAGARTPGLTGRRGDAWTVRVAAPPERGRANAEIEKLFAEVLGVRRRDVRVVAGETARDKVVEIAGVGVAAALACLEERVAGAAS